MKKTEIIKALQKIVSSNDLFKAKILNFFHEYIDGLDNLANDAFEVASSVIDFEGKKILKDAEKLLDEFQNYHDIKKATYSEILDEFNYIELAEKKRVTSDTLKVFKYDISQLLKIYNVRAQVKVEDILLNEIEDQFKRLSGLQKLVSITFDDILYFWENLPEEYILTY